MTAASPARLPVWRLAAYGIAGMPVALLGVPLFIYLPSHYAGPAIGLSLALVGWLMFANRIWDVVTDPLIGWLSDRSRSRFGRRRPFIIAGAPLVMLAATQLLTPEPGVGALHLAFWLFILTLGGTMILIPYAAWGAELSADYAERARVTGWREGFTILGTLVAVAIPAVVAGAGGADEKDPAKLGAALAVLETTVLIMVPVTLAILLLGVREPARVPLVFPVAAPAVVPVAPSARLAKLRAALRSMWTNRPFRLLLTAWLLNGVANGLPGTLFPFFVIYVLDAAPLLPTLLLAYFIPGILSVPLWVWLAGRIGKHRTWVLSMLGACGVFATVPLLGAGDGDLFLIVCVLTGMALGADLALPPAMQADVVDLDSARRGARLGQGGQAPGGQTAPTGRAGQFFAAWGMATKMTVATAALALPALAVFGFDPGAGSAPPQSLLALALLYALVPVVFKLLAVALVWRFPIDARRQARIRARLTRQAARRGHPQ